MTDRGAELGRRLINEMRAFDADDEASAVGEATDLLRWGADEVDDETLWTAVITAAELARDDAERWMLGDGPIDESIATREPLRRRWAAARRTNASVAEVYRVMCDPRWTWSDEPGWWAEG